MVKYILYNYSHIISLIYSPRIWHGDMRPYYWALRAHVVMRESSLIINLWYCSSSTLTGWWGNFLMYSRDVVARGFIGLLMRVNCLSMWKRPEMVFWRAHGSRDRLYWRVEKCRDWGHLSSAVFPANPNVKTYHMRWRGNALLVATGDEIQPYFKMSILCNFSRK